MSFKLYVTQDTAPAGAIAAGVVASAVASYRSLPVLLGGDSAALGLDIETTGTLTGVWTLWYSNALAPDFTAASDADWVQDTSFSPTNPAGAATHWFVPLGNVNARWARLKFVTSAGAGSIFADANVPRLR